MCWCLSCRRHHLHLYRPGQWRYRPRRQKLERSSKTSSAGAWRLICFIRPCTSPNSLSPLYTRSSMGPLRPSLGRVHLAADPVHLPSYGKSTGRNISRYQGRCTRRLLEINQEAMRMWADIKRCWHLFLSDETSIGSGASLFGTPSRIAGRQSSRFFGWFMIERLMIIFFNLGMISRVYACYHDC